VSDAAPEPQPGSEEPAYHLLLDPEEIPVAASALRLLISDEAHEPVIRGLARDVLEQLAAGHPHERLTLTLSPPQMKITHSAVRLLLNDLQRGQADERELLRQILEKLPDEHVMRAIQID
jgi:hypothetical protein